MTALVARRIAGDVPAPASVSATALALFNTMSAVSVPSMPSEAMATPYMPASIHGM